MWLKNRASHRATYPCLMRTHLGVWLLFGILFVLYYSLLHTLLLKNNIIFLGHLRINLYGKSSPGPPTGTQRRSSLGQVLLRHSPLNLSMTGPGSRYQKEGGPGLLTKLLKVVEIWHFELGTGILRRRRR